LQRQHRNCRAEATSRWSVHRHRCNCVTHTHGGLTPAALAGTFASRRTVLDFCDSPLYHPPRRADTRRSWECAFVHRTNRFFPDKRSHCTKSGGRKPPVGYKTPLQIATAFLQQSARGQPGATGVSPPWDVLGMRTRNAEIQRVAVANVVSDQRQVDAGRWTKASAIAIALLIPTAG
jgi:hypothetical protein